MTTTLTFATGLVAAGLLWLTVKGAYALTGSAAITIVLGSLVVLQWVAARKALAALFDSRSGGRWRRVLAPALIWFAAACITVSFVGAELYEMFTARGQAESRFEAEQSRLRMRAVELQQALSTTATVAGQYQKHAAEAARREEQQGGSCMAGSQPGPGDLRAAGG